MAANLRQRGFACLGKQFVERAWIGGSKDPARPLSAFRRSVVHSHFSAYDKNPDEAVHPAAVPDDVIQPHDSSDKYWAPHPDTGVFGPSEQNSDAAIPAASRRPAPAAANGSVLEEKAWFRPLEDVDKPRSS